MSRQWYEIVLVTENKVAHNKTRDVIAKVKSKGLAYIAMQKFSEVYQGTPYTDVSILIEPDIRSAFVK